jgi:hypothetical protein
MRRFRGRSALRYRAGVVGRPSTGAAFDEFTLAFNGNKSVEVEQQRQEAERREDEDDGAPPLTRIDLINGTARVVLPR